MSAPSVEPWTAVLCAPAGCAAKNAARGSYRIRRALDAWLFGDDDGGA